MDFSLIGILFIAFWGVYAGCLLWRKRQTDEVFEIKKYPLLAGAIYSAVFLSLAAVMFVGRLCPVKVYAYLMISGLGLLYAVARWNNIKYWLCGMPVLCSLGVLVFVCSFPGLSFVWYEYILYALFWALFVGLFVVFDRVHCCSYLQGLIWGGATLLALLLSMIIPTHIPLFFSVLGSILLVIMLGIGKILIKWQIPILGVYASVLVGFLWGALFTFALMNHKILSVALMLNNYIFALTFGLLLLWKLTRKLKISYMDFYQVFSSNAQASTLGAVLKNCGALSCLGVLLWSLGNAHPELGGMNFYAGIGIIVLICYLNLYNRIQDGGAPPPRIRDILSSAVQGIKVGIANGKQEVKEMVSLREVKKESASFSPKKAVSKTKKKITKKKLKKQQK